MIFPGFLLLRADPDWAETLSAYSLSGGLVPGPASTSCCGSSWLWSCFKAITGSGVFQLSHAGLGCCCSELMDVRYVHKAWLIPACVMAGLGKCSLFPEYFPP